jgi:hypothetical protein
MIQLRKATEKDIQEIGKIYALGGMDEVKLQFPEKSSKELILDFEKHKKDRIKGFVRGINSRLEYWVVAEEYGDIIGFGHASINKENA